MQWTRIHNLQHPAESVSVYPKPVEPMNPLIPYHGALEFYGDAIDLSYSLTSTATIGQQADLDAKSSFDSPFA